MVRYATLFKPPHAKYTVLTIAVITAAVGRLMRITVEIAAAPLT